MDRLEKQVAFILEADKEKNIFRQTRLSNHGRHENDAEHAWHMAMMVYLLKEHANEEIDIAKAMMMCLIHDIVEIDAGDTYAYDADGLSSQQEREQKAAQRIFGLLPDDQKEEMIQLFNEFEEYKTPEARFARAMDNFQPMILNYSNDGGDWKEYNVSKSKIINRQSKTELGSKTLWKYSEDKINELVKNGNLKDE